MTLLPAAEIETNSNPEYSLIWLHGLGADGNDFSPLIPQLHLPAELRIRFIFPHAPEIPVTVNGGYVMPAWYDILEMDIERKIDTRGLLKSVALIEKFIDREIERGIPSRRILLAGFSQGGAVAYQLALGTTKELGGLLALSTYFATNDSIEIRQPNLEMPIEIHHGLYDPVVPEILGQQAREKLESNGWTVTYQTYPMEHAVCPEQIEDISLWLQKTLSRIAKNG